MSIFQLIAIFFAFLMLYIVNIHRRKLSLSSGETFFWYVLWISFITLALYPDILLGVVGILNFSRVFDLLVVIAMMIISTLVVLSYFSHKAAAKKFEDFIRSDALGKKRKK